MQLQGKHAEETAQKIVDTFRNPNDLAHTLERLFLHRNESAPCHKWAWHNRLLVTLAHAEDARSMESWNKAGRSIRKGAKALWILTTLTRRDTGGDAHGNPVHTTAVLGYRAVPVFAVEDTEGAPLGESRPAPAALELPLEELLLRLGHDRRDAPPRRHSPLMLASAVADSAYRETTRGESAGWDRNLVRELAASVLLACMGETPRLDGGRYWHAVEQATAPHPPDFPACLTILNRTCRCVDYVLKAACPAEHSAPALR